MLRENIINDVKTIIALDDQTLDIPKQIDSIDMDGSAICTSEGMLTPEEQVVKLYEKWSELYFKARGIEEDLVGLALDDLMKAYQMALSMEDTHKENILNTLARLIAMARSKNKERR